MSDPTWSDSIKDLFAAPYWIAPDRRASIGAKWQGCMAGYQMDFTSYESVRSWSVTIYRHLFSYDMPLTRDPTELWPDEALELFRTWVNQGWRQATDSPYSREERIVRPAPRPAKLRVRKNILDLSPEELATYRMKLDELRVGDAAPTSPWQSFAAVHTNWCLHYQEAFLLWHRAYLLHFEQLIDFPVPYWDFMDPDVSNPDSPLGGIPQAFKDETYVHPLTGEVRKNPLRYAAAWNGRSKACPEPSTREADGTSCYWVHRDPVLYTSGPECHEQRKQKLALLTKYREQVEDALKFNAFSVPQGDPGYPWANIQSFIPEPPDSDYPYRTMNFDGAYEQPHDNYHGWIGMDMGDNSYTAYDPIFWSYHSNIDRIFEVWKRANPAAMYTAPFVLRPFIGPLAKELDFTSRQKYLFTTIGDMARDCRGLGFDYAASRCELSLPEGDGAESLFVVFDGVRCTHDSYAIDAFLNLDMPTLSDVRADNPHYVGRLMRIGMGSEDENGRCIEQGVRRVLNAGRNAARLMLSADSECRLSLLVTESATGRVLPREEYEALPGFLARLVWSRNLPPRRGRKPVCSGGACPMSTSKS